jgi:solute carrier family 35 protein C2
MCKSSSLAFVLLFSLVGIITIISIGVLLMVADETSFELIGFIQVMLASLMGGLRWSLTQMLLRSSHHNESTTQRERSTHRQTSNHHHQHPIASIMLLSPVMGICLLIAAGILEQSVFSSHFFSDFSSIIRTLFFMSLGGIIAFVMVVCEFAVIKSVGVVTLSVCGIFKASDEYTLLNLINHSFIFIGSINNYRFYYCIW